MSSRTADDLVAAALPVYLVAYDRDRQDWRSFRVDRIDAPRTSGQHCRPRDIPGGDALAFVQAGIGSIPQRYGVRVRVAADPVTVARAVGRWGEVTPYDGGCVLAMSVDDLQWPVMVLAQLGADFTVESPDELAAEVARVSACFARAAG